MKTAYFIGTCVNSFDDDGDCVIRGLYNDVSDFAVHEENSERISKAEFTNAVGWVDEELCKSIGKKREYQSDDGIIYMIYDVKANVHYFFRPLVVGSVARNPAKQTYQITKRQLSNAQSLNVTIKPSTNTKKKIDVFQSMVKLCSIGAAGYMDYDLYLADGDKQLADKRRKLYKSRHEGDRHKAGSPGFFADKILW